VGRIGETLREARERKNLTLKDAEEATKIRLKYLQDLENENFENLPGRAYAIGFLKTYAKYLQIEDQALVEEFKAKNRSDEYIQNQRSKSNVNRKIEINIQPGRIHRLLLIGLVIVLLIGTNFLYNYLDNKNTIDQGEDLKPEVIVEEPNQNEEVSPQPSDEGGIDQGLPDLPGNNIDKIQVSVKISEEENSKCWINVVADDKNIFSGTLTSGEEKSFEANDKLEIKLGNAGVAYIVANGEELGTLGSKGSVVTKLFEKDSL
jgi:cytoskeleton protein RodZ